MENETLTLTLGQKAVEWWCPTGRDTTGLAGVVTAKLAQAQGALAQEDWATYHHFLNHVAATDLGYDGEDQEDELLGYLDDLCRGYR